MDRQLTGLFVTGTDTDVGKTYVAAQIARAGVQQGHRVGVYKPVLSGCNPDARDQADDWILWHAAACPGRLEDVCPQRFAAPLAPPLAAQQESRTVDEARLTLGIQPWSEGYDLVIVEGVGGLMSPIADGLYVADVAVEMGLPLIVVAPNRLGVINQTLQTLITACTFRDGLSVAGVVLNDVDAGGLHDASLDLNEQQLREHCVPELLARVGHTETGVLDAIDWLSIARSVG